MNRACTLGELGLLLGCPAQGERPNSTNTADMCARYTLHHSVEQLVIRFEATLAAPELATTAARYNIPPTSRVFVVREQPPGTDAPTRSLDRLRWGLIPFWAKDPSIGQKMINARSETLLEKPSFKGLLKRNRCLIPSSGFYEWKTLGGKKQPVHIRRCDGELFAFAGLWTRWRQPDGTDLETVTMCTTEPNELMAPIHNRMPVILDAEGEAAWLDERVSPGEAVMYLRPAPEGLLEAYEVDPAVNKPGNDGPGCIERITVA